MPAPVIEQIAVELQARLNQISLANGYSRDIPAVVRPARYEGVTVDDGLIVFEQTGHELDPEGEIDGCPNALAWMVEFSIDVFIRASDCDNEPTDTKVNYIVSDVVKAIGEPTAWHTFGGLAFWSRVTGLDYWNVTDGAHSGATITLSVHYRTNENDLYTAR